ncbi:TPR repeat family protein [Clavispora lusitaniae]|uniref:TPR repeat family protein n=1 Tax=Clavispora lusitaniae TaxID=36911 RepID=UPI00202C8B18|nr:TPR repeat family protein [Clavispora lusitaniae]
MPTSAEFKAKGNEAFAEKQFLKAAKLYREAITLDPNNPVLFSNRAQCFINLSDWDRAYRDTEKGLALNPERKIKSKLLYRRGISSKQLGYTDLALKSFQEVVKLDPANSSALEESQFLSDMNKKHKSSAGAQIPIEYVDKLPPQFDLIVTPTGAEDQSNKSHSSLNEQDVNQAVEELFGKKATEEHLSTPKKSNSLNFNEMPSMHYLKSLTTSPPERKINAYKLVVDLETTTIRDLFGKTGVDHEFFELFIEASTFAITEGYKSVSSILSILRLYSSLPRFSIVSRMCPDSLKSDLFTAVQRSSPACLDSFKSLFS